MFQACLTILESTSTLATISYLHFLTDSCDLSSTAPRSTKAICYWRFSYDIAYLRGSHAKNRWWTVPLTLRLSGNERVNGSRRPLIWTSHVCSLVNRKRSRLSNKRARECLVRNRGLKIPFPTRHVYTKITDEVCQFRTDFLRYLQGIAAVF